MIKSADYEGCGNTFSIVDCRNIELDGFVLVLPDRVADFRIRIFNRDGSEAGSCGNALRCMMQFLIDSGLPRKKHTIALNDRIVEADFVGDLISIQLGIPKDLQLNILPNVHFVDTGVPHAVVFVDDVDAVDVFNEGKKLRYHPIFPGGTNVNFAALQKDGSIKVRTYERGVEGETKACGTGAGAVTVIASHLHNVTGPTRIFFPGGELSIHYQNQITMIGPTKKIEQL
jgi:diaminopimelate epimerase